MPQDTLNYSVMIDKAMRGVVREALTRVSANGLPGDHHFYISYATEHPDVKMSEQLKSRYPKEITIVMQHQFWDFKVEESQFSVTLSFGGVPEKLVVPFAALTAFADPSVKFGLQFQHTEMFNPQIVDTEAAYAKPVSVSVDGEEEEIGAAEIISLDAFRKK
jgi:hypothetical protein